MTYVRKSMVRYDGQFLYVGHYLRRSPDVDGNERNAIVFELAPFAELTLDAQSNSIEPHVQLPALSLSELRARALADSAVNLPAKERTSLVRKRSAAVRQYVLMRAAGTCEGCKSPAPFKTSAGTPYLEPHHLYRVSDGGPEHPRWVAAVSANAIDGLIIR
jgi:5-methylcytosine-specific restriction protein A